MVAGFWFIMTWPFFVLTFRKVFSTLFAMVFFFCNKFILNGELAYKTGLSQGVSDNRLEYIFWNLIEDAWFLFHVFFFLVLFRKVWADIVFVCPSVHFYICIVMNSFKRANLFVQNVR